MNTAATINPESHSVYLARQPILDKSKELYAYELLYRSARTGKAEFKNANLATTKLITNTFLEIGIESISDNKLVFINLPRAFVTGDFPLPFTPQNIVLEILEDIVADEKSIAGIRRLAETGFTIALDDFVLDGNNIKFLPYADIIKIDITVLSREQLQAQVEKLKKHKVRLLAEKVETEEEFKFCQKLGFDYFQGYFFCRPNIIEGRQVPTNQLTLLNILARLQNPNTDIQEVENIISNDVGLSYKLLKILNSSLYNLGKNIESIQHALVILGMNTLKKWLTLLSLSSVQNKPPELINRILIRAKMCEEVAKRTNLKMETAFTVGLFSLLDALMDRSLEQIMASLPLSADIVNAIIKNEGHLGKLLVAVQHYETGDWDRIDPAFLHQGAMNHAYTAAIAWQTQLSAELANI